MRIASAPLNTALFFAIVIGIYECKPCWLSGLGDLGPGFWVAAIKVGMLVILTNAFQGDTGDSVLLLE